ncbi:outer membrane porin, OprD family [Acinetobacter wuhouensis]|uniref:OprD family outer membrane porin n=1 Tax=Acinetobacter wuhouensis TaxID=1879050 RepID=UPI001022E9A7|nr:OprD family outer membrane porin [Acinetobacter wuhouensis]RZG72514.1 outer membrane porin, OprD family [Acinetobacter wuhouensis]
MNKAFLFIALGPLLPIQSFANSFIDDSNIKLTTRNYYLDRDFTDFKPIPGAKDWAQGFIFNFNSGYTPGKVGFGLDIQTLSSIKLQGNKKYLGSGLLTTDSVTRERADTASEIGITGKVKYKQTEVKVGTLQPWTPVIFSSPSRLLPQTFRGALVQSKDIKDLELTAGYIDQVNHRDSTNHEDLSNITFNGRFKAAKTDEFSFTGGKYNVSPATQVGVYYGMADDIYDQAALTFKNTYQMKEDTKLITDLRLWNSTENGQANAGKVDNTLVTGNFGLAHNNHTLTFSTMQNYGDTAHPYLSGGEVLIYIDGWSTDFLNPKEKVYGIRYDYDFKDYIPGLKAMTRYTKGNNIHLPNLGGNDLKEDSLDFDLQYTLQTGVLKGLGLRGRYAIYDNNFAQNASFKPANETRVNIDYTWKFK